MGVERWLAVVGFDGYFVSSTGRVASLRTEDLRVLNPRLGTTGYLSVDLMQEGRALTRRVHQLVAAAFLGERPEGQEIRHLDGDALNNTLDNLAYGTSSENHQDTLRHGTHSNAAKTHCPAGHVYDAANTYRNPRGGRTCRKCRLAKQRQRHAGARA